MDANGLNFWMLSTHDDWLPPGGQPDLAYCAQNHWLTLRSTRNGPPLAEDLASAQAAVEVTPFTTDSFGNTARWDAASGHVMASGSAPGEVPIFTPPPLQPVSDLALGDDGVLYVAAGPSLSFIDRRNRWPDFTLTAPNFIPWRLLPLPGGGVLVLDRVNAQLLLVTGQPPVTLPLAARASGVLGSCAASPNPPRIAARIALPAQETYVALAPTSDSTRFALLSWPGAPATPTQTTPPNLRLFTLDPTPFTSPDLLPTPATNQLQLAAAPGLAAPIALTGIRFPHALAPLPGNQFATLLATTNEALVFDVSDALASAQPTSAAPSGDSYILATPNPGPFVHQPLPATTPRYATGPATSQPLLPLSLNALAPTATATAQRVIDSGTLSTQWHRLFLEAVIPPRTGLILWLAASDDPAALTSPEQPWYPHTAGLVDPALLPPETPTCVWLSTPSEVAFATPLLSAPPQPNRSGLFMALIQRANTTVRTLSGRYLAVRLQLFGDRRTTPQVAALRLYGSRFSYIQHYLPELYREDTFPPDADLPGPATPPDFLERYVDIVESQLTRIEDSVIHSYLLTRPDSTPDSALDWLGGWVGIHPASLPGNAYPPNRRRDRLNAIPQLYKQRGTVTGITRAIDIATGGLCTRGAVILLEDFRLRHTFATILGADLSIQNDPLLPGYSASSNSFVGDTLFLGDPHHQEFLALFAEDVNSPAAATFYDQLAFRLTLFVHDQVEPVDLALLQTLLDQEKPAHVKATLRRATQSFMIGLASLVGVNTYLAPTPATQPVRVGVSSVGMRDLVFHAPSLDPRFDADPAYQQYASPIARIATPAVVPAGTTTLTLDASASQVPTGRSIAAYHWTLSEPQPGS